MSKIVEEKVELMREQIAKYPYAVQIIFLAIFAMLMFLPFGMGKMDLFNHEQMPPLLYPFTVLFSGLVQKNFLFLYISCFSFFLLPVVFLIIFVSIFYKKITQNA